MRRRALILWVLVLCGGVSACASRAGRWPVRTVDTLEGAPLHELIRGFGPPDQLFEQSGDVARSRRPGERMPAWRTDGFMLVYLEPRIVVHTNRYGRVERVEPMDDREFESWRASIREWEAFDGS